MAPGQASSYRQPLRTSALVWRHCPYGLHTLIDQKPSEPRIYVYVTMLRDPLERMMSWFAYCNKYSPNKCNAGKDFSKKVSDPRGPIVSCINPWIEEGAHLPTRPSGACKVKQHVLALVQLANILAHHESSVVFIRYLG